MATLMQLTYIVAVDTHRHFGRAAAECLVAQPSLSAQIDKVESELGFKIFDRSQRRVTTTDFGVPFVAQSRVVLKEYHALMSGPAANHEIAGDFHLAVLPTIGPYFLPRFLTPFSESYPKVNLEISELKTNEILTALHEDRIDAGILATPLGHSGLIEDRLYLEPFYLFVSAHHPLVGQQIMAESALKSVGPLWLLEEGHCFRNQALRICQEIAAPILPNVTLNSGSLETLVRLVQNGSGATLLPELATRLLTPAEKSNQLLRFSDPMPSREVSMIYGRRYQKQGILTAIKTIVSAFDDGEPHAYRRAVDPG